MVEVFSWPATPSFPAFYTGTGCLLPSHQFLVAVGGVVFMFIKFVRIVDVPWLIAMAGGKALSCQPATQKSR